ncbi:MULTISPECIES: Crp/Fnr family transcriptional regulator [Anaerotruncus]|jgi:CRP-like cAMP-binding protein|uniref:Crp/Fnr family transcriptional regulator n=1 Tax=Anaerotruncus colihominis TaxID=169435 RepID=A0A845SZ49_9FIRM|nr:MULTISPECIES: Crp/Fnr family transcriptional regulator [Anaerotruncus]MCI8492966.1 Crp/Fnr family transcriptional regulator [Anaerotruncus sp.]MCR2024254.1 Crp/Fnr family transcriptional regulator [Anaerotruncus colihominis]NDO39197.1 Crp/Fnr family transcriptional regulator [Anaerotruncus colihominis]
MEKYFDILKNVSLFHGIDPADYPRMLACLKASPKRFLAGESILLAGDPADRVGILLEGRAQVVREELSGSRTILTALEPADLFAEVFVCASGGKKTLPVSVFSVTDSAVLLLDYRRIISSGPEGCAFHDRLVENMLAVMADKNLMLNRRIGHLSRRLTREKLLSYLSEQAALCGGSEFDIPFDRQELADYLCVERSAMSAILSKLRAQGVLEYNRRHFRLLALPKEHAGESFFPD